MHYVSTQTSNILSFNCVILIKMNQIDNNSISLCINLVDWIELFPRLEMLSTFFQHYFIVTGVQLRSLQTPRTSQHYGTEGFKGAPWLGSHYAERRQHYWTPETDDVIFPSLGHTLLLMRIWLLLLFNNIIILLFKGSIISNDE